MRSTGGFACALAAVTALTLAGCNAEAPTSAAPAPAAATAEPASGSGTSSTGHDHTHAGGEALPPAGDGTSAYQIGYTIRDVRLPARAGEPGRLSFVIENYRGRTQTEFLPELTKEMHVYVVRDDLSVFRHVHPQMPSIQVSSSPAST